MEEGVKSKIWMVQMYEDEEDGNEDNGRRSRDRRCCAGHRSIMVMHVSSR